jgi:hypothetical protein
MQLKTVLYVDLESKNEFNEIDYFWGSRLVAMDDIVAAVENDNCFSDSTLAVLKEVIRRYGKRDMDVYFDG